MAGGGGCIEINSGNEMRGSKENILANEILPKRFEKSFFRQNIRTQRGENLE